MKVNWFTSFSLSAVHFNNVLVSRSIIPEFVCRSRADVASRISNKRKKKVSWLLINLFRAIHQNKVLVYKSTKAHFGERNPALGRDVKLRLRILELFQSKILRSRLIRPH